MNFLSGMQLYSESSLLDAPAVFKPAPWWFERRVATQSEGPAAAARASLIPPPTSAMVLCVRSGPPC